MLTTKNALMANGCCTWRKSSGSFKVATRSPLLNEQRFHVEVAAERSPSLHVLLEFYSRKLILNTGGEDDRLGRAKEDEGGEAKGQGQGEE